MRCAAAETGTCAQVRMTQDVPQEGFFYSALQSFVSRTCYANTHGVCCSREGHGVD